MGEIQGLIKEYRRNASEKRVLRDVNYEL